MRNWFQRFMSGRYGSDQLSRFTMALAMVMLVLNIFFGKKTPVFSVLIWLLIILTYFRMFSRNISRRYNENTRYLELKTRVLDFFSGLFSRKSYRSGRSGSGSGSRPDADHKIFRCPNCKQRVRVPRGRGKIEITCPRCDAQFVKRT